MPRPYILDLDDFDPGETRTLERFGIRLYRNTDDVATIMIEPLAHDEEQIKSPAPEPAQKQPLDAPHGEPFSPDRRVVAPAPLQDAIPEEVEMIEGVGREAESELDDLHAQESAFQGAAERALLLGFRAGFNLGKAWLLGGSL